MVQVETTDEKSLSSENSTFTLRSHGRQFVLGLQLFRPHADWYCRQIDQAIWVSHCPDLRVGWANDAEGCLWVLLGLAVETIESKPDPLTAIAQTSSAEVPNLYSSWAGRWVLFGRGEVHLDATGRLGCFYGKTPDDQTWVSSSPALLASILSPDAELVVDSRKLQYEFGISWYTPPRSRFGGIYRLLPSQVVTVPHGRIRPRPLMPPIDPTRSYDETIELLKRSLMMALKRLPKPKGKLWLGLSAGYDSRTILAIARYANIDIVPFTRISSRTPVADQVLPPQLARECGYEHVFVRGSSKYYPQRQQLIAEHTAGHVSDGDGQPLLYGVRDSLTGIAFGGHCFEVGSGFGRLRELPETVTDAEIAAQQLVHNFGEPVNSTATAGIREWLEWAFQTPQPNLDWRDRFYIEQRQAGWASSKEQMYDLAQLERFFVVNAARNYSLMLGLQESQRLGSLIQVELIRQIAPELLKYPFNPPDSYFGILRVTAIKSTNDPLYLYRSIAGKLRRMWHSLSS